MAKKVLSLLIGTHKLFSIPRWGRKIMDGADLKFLTYFYFPHLSEKRWERGKKNHTTRLCNINNSSSSNKSGTNCHISWHLNWIWSTCFVWKKNCDCFPLRLCVSRLMWSVLKVSINNIVINNIYLLFLLFGINVAFHLLWACPRKVIFL